MTKIQEVNEILMAVGCRDGVPNLQLSTSGCVGLQLKQGCRLCFQWVPSDQALCVYTPLVLLEDIPEKDRGELCLQLLGMNCLSTTTTVAFAKEAGALLLQTTLLFELLTIRFLDAVIDRLLSCRAEILETIQRDFID